MCAAEIPLRVRFEQARGALERAVDDPLYSTGRYGTYSGDVHRRAGRNVVFWVRSGGFMDDAGFAYLPDGPSAIPADPTFESPRFSHLTGDWYTWTASW